MTFDIRERELLGRLADVLIPAGEGMPSASQAGVAQQGLDAILTARPDLAEPLKLLLHRVGSASPSEILKDWRQKDAAAFSVLAEVVPAAYFLNPTVRQALGYAGQTPLEIDPRPDYMEDDLLGSVIRRGPIYRPTPKTG